MDKFTKIGRLTVIIVSALSAMLAVLIFYGGWSRAPEHDKADALTTAIDNGDVSKIRQLIAEDRTILKAVGVKCATTPINYAAGRGRINIVDLLLRSGVDVNQAGPGGVTPLHSASAEGRNAMVEFLLSMGANVNAKAYKGITPLHKAVNSRKIEVVQTLLFRGADITAKGAFDKFPGESRNGNECYTPLQWALRIDAIDIADLLRANGAKE